MSADEKDINIALELWPNIETELDRDFIAEPPFLMHINGVAGHDYSKRNFAEPIEDPLSFDEDAESLLSFACKPSINYHDEIILKLEEGKLFLTLIQNPASHNTRSQI